LKGRGFSRAVIDLFNVILSGARVREAKSCVVEGSLPSELALACAGPAFVDMRENSFRSGVRFEQGSFDSVAAPLRRAAIAFRMTVTESGN